MTPRPLESVSDLMAIKWDDGTVTDEAPPPTRIRWDDGTTEDVPSSALGKTPPLAAFLLGAGREITSPIRSIRSLVGAAPSERDLTREALAAQLAEEHPIATGLGTAAGFIPSLAVGGLATKPLRLLPLISRLEKGGRLARMGAEGIKLAAQGAAAEAIQGRPEEILRTSATFASLAPAGAVAGRGFRALAKRAAVGAGSVGATAAVLAPEGQRLKQGAFGAGVGTVGGALTRPLARPSVRPTGGVPGAAPESYWIPAERISVQEAAEAAKEGFATFKRPFVRLTERQELEAFQAKYPGLFPEEAIAGKTTERFLGKGQVSELTPNFASSSGEASGALSTEAIMTPPRSQPLGPQVSDQALTPSETTRLIAPSTKAGEARISKPLFVGDIDPTSKQTILQTTKDVNVLLRRASESKRFFDQQLSEIILREKGTEFLGSRVKDRIRLSQKIQAGKNPRSIGDYLAGRISVDNLSMLSSVENKLRGELSPIFIQDFIKNPKQGYRGIHLHVDTPNGLTAEVAILPREIADVIDDAHRFYEVFRSPTSTKAQIVRAQAQSKVILDTAWKRFLTRIRSEGGFVFIPEEAPQAVRQAVRTGAFAAVESRLRQRADQLSAGVESVSERLGVKLSERAQMVAGETEAIAQTGTVSPEARPVLRQMGESPKTLTLEFSEQQILQNQAELVRLKREMDGLTRTLQVVGDQGSSNAARAAQTSLTEAQRVFNNEVNRFRRLRFAAGRSVKRFDVPPELAAALREAGVLTGGLRSAKARLPIYTNIMRSLKNLHQLSPTEQQQFARDLVDAWRLNLFAVTSWTLDLGGNLTETAAQVGGAVGRDLGHVLGGRLTFPSLQGFFRAIRMKGRALPTQAAEGIEQQVAGGELVRLGGFNRGPGTFTTRTTPASTAVDFLVGSPLYAKGVVDAGFRRFVATAQLWRQAIEAADRQGLKGLARREFYDAFWKNTPQDAIDAAVREGNKAGFARTLSQMEERIAGSTAMRLFGDAFARWPFQFTRALAEWVGVNPQLLRRIATGRQAADLGEYLGKTLTGWGGIWMVNEVFYDHVDWRSMEYVTEEGNRIRLSGRDPIPSILFLLASIKRDWSASTEAMRFASLPFMRILTGFAPGQRFEGGLLGGLMGQISRAIEQRQVLPRALRRELENTVNRLIPGQSLLSAMKTVFDPITREGIGANLPGVSRLLPAAIDPTTGEPMRIRQRFPPRTGPEMPSIGGTPIPGAERVLNPVQRLLLTLGLGVYRGPSSPIVGVPASQIDESLRREWTIELGRQRQRLLAPIANQPGLMRRLESNPRIRELTRKRVQGLDAMAGRLATNIVQRRHGGKRVVPRKPTRREEALPRRFVRTPMRVFQQQQRQLREIPGGTRIRWDDGTIE